MCIVQKSLLHNSSGLARRSVIMVIKCRGGVGLPYMTSTIFFHFLPLSPPFATFLSCLSANLGYLATSRLLSVRTSFMEAPAAPRRRVGGNELTARKESGARSEDAPLSVFLRTFFAAFGGITKG